MNIYSWILIIILTFVFLIVFCVFLKLKGHQEFLAKQNYYIRSHWIRIIDMCNNNPIQSVIDADKILDYALNVKGFKGSMGDKLKKAGRRFSNLNGLWEAHKLRNKLAHEFKEVKLVEARKALAEFKRALLDLGAEI
ncbi:MAG: hypothetical protein WC806_01640 [Candidatus Gracilibacteria bacterium]|jgi:hypothetical protein